MSSAIEDEVEIFQAQSSFPTYDEEGNNSKEDCSSCKIEEVQTHSPSKHQQKQKSDKQIHQPSLEDEEEEEDKASDCDNSEKSLPSPQRLTSQNA